MFGKKLELQVLRRVDNNESSNFNTQHNKVIVVLLHDVVSVVVQATMIKFDNKVWTNGVYISPTQ